MKILLINNHTQHLSELSLALKGHEVEVREYQPGMNFNYDDKDLIILSGGGGEGLEIDDEHKPGKLWYEDQMKFIKGCQKPIIGICMGFEVIARAFGAPVKQMPKGIEQFLEFQTTALGKKLLGRTRLSQFEAHDWHVTNVPEDFDVLAGSETGIEIIRHKTRPILATQFHPEKGGTLGLRQLVSSIMS